MATTNKRPITDVGIFARLLENGEKRMSVQLARYVLKLGFTDQDRARMEDLADRNQESLLSQEERDELFAYVSAGHMLGLLHSKARRALSQKKPA